MTEARPRPTRPPTVPIGVGHHLFVRDWGRGRPVVLMAGWGMDSRLWAEVMIALNAAGLRTIAYDRRGHGLSSDPGTLDYDALADDLAKVLDAVGETGITLVCHSGAGGEAIRYVTRYGASRLSRIVLVGATGPRFIPADDPGGQRRGAAEAVIAMLGNDMANWLSAVLRPFAPQADDRVLEWAAMMVLNCSRRALVDFQRAIVEADFEDEVAALSLPVTIIHGTEDASAPLETTARRYASLAGTSELIVYEGGAHGIMLTHAERLAADIAASASA